MLAVWLSELQQFKSGLIRRCVADGRHRELWLLELVLWQLWNVVMPSTNPKNHKMGGISTIPSRFIISIDVY
jgi:hypothetical protein